MSLISWSDGHIDVFNVIEKLCLKAVWKFSAKRLRSDGVRLSGVIGSATVSEELLMPEN